MKNIKKRQKAALRTSQYKKAFLLPVGFRARDGKSVYISPEFHEKLSRIVFMLGKGNITITDYLYNILDQHFKDFNEEIKTMYNAYNKPI